MKSFVKVFSCIVAIAFAFQTASAETPSGISVQGKVLQEPGGQPIRKANLQFNLQFDAHGGDSNGQFSATTDSEGQFKIDDLKPGRYTVVVEHPGFVQSGRGRRSRSISLLPGQGTTDLVFHMQPAAVITGKIVDLDGDPMSNVGVGALRVGSTRRGRSRHESGDGLTNDLGEFRIPDLRAGRYTITANPPQRTVAAHQQKEDPKEEVIYATTYYPGTLDKEQSVAVEVHPGDETPINFGVLASPAYRVTGTMVGIPSKGMVEIFLSSKDHGAMENAQHLSEGGKFEFQNVLPGSYTVRLGKL